jgi:hypothetical protein
MGVNIRMLPANGSGSTVNGVCGSPNPNDLARRYYSATGGQTIDATGYPDGDAAVLASQGFLPVCASGTTALRNSLTPGKHFKPGTLYLDTTIGLIVCWDGASWRNPVNGAVA